MGDPLGLFRTSPIVRMNELDERTLETTRNLINLIGDQVQANGKNILDVSGLSAAERQTILTTLVRKVWSKRDGLLLTGNRLVTKLLQLTADKLEAGEREILVLPTVNQDLKTEQHNNVENGINYGVHKSPSPSPSPRVLNAQKILLDVEQQELLEKSS